MQKLPDLINTLEPGKKARGTGNASESCDMVEMASEPTIPPVLQVEHPNKYNTSTVQLDELKVSDLKAACKELGMIVSGKKVELVERLLENNKGVLPAIALPDAQAIVDPFESLTPVMSSKGLTSPPQGKLEVLVVISSW